MTVTVTLTMTASGTDPDGALAKVVKQVECVFTASDGSNSADAMDGVALDAPDANNFKAADNLTAADLLAFVQAAKGDGYMAWRSAMEAAATARLTAPKNFVLLMVEAPA